MKPANNRYYSNAYGRFMTPDPSASSAHPSDPQTWNRYAYTVGDPVNRLDPSGLDYTDPTTDGSQGCMVAGDYDASIQCDFGGGFVESGASSIDPGWAVLWSVYLQAGAFSVSGPPKTSSSAPPLPSCDDVLTLEVSSFLSTQDPKLLTWDPALAAQLVAAGQTYGVDPRLMASIATLESGHGTVFGGTNNPFGLGPKLNFSTPGSAVNAEGRTLSHLIGYGDNTVAKLYSGLPGVLNGKGGFSQVPGYCQTSVAACQAAGVTVSGFLTSTFFMAAQGVGLAAGNPNNLAFPCP
jgi:hypothetical protein